MSDSLAIARPDMAQKVSDIYDKHQSELRGYISRRVTFKEDCEDILQNVFYQLSRIDLAENPITHVSAWLYSVARNQIIDRKRKHTEQRMPQVKKDPDDEEFPPDLSYFLSDDQTPETEYLRLMVRDAVEIALGELPPEQRNVFELTELQGFLFREISESTGIAVNTLISRKHYAVLHLRKRLDGLYKEFFD